MPCAYGFVDGSADEVERDAVFGHVTGGQIA